MRTLTGHAHRPGDMRDRHPLLSDPTNQQTATMHRQPSVTVRHEDLRVVETANPHSFGGLRFTSTDRHQRPGRVHLAVRNTNSPQLFTSEFCVPVPYALSLFATQPFPAE